MGPPSYKLPIPFPYFKGFENGSAMGVARVNGGPTCLGVPEISIEMRAPIRCKGRRLLWGGMVPRHGFG